MRDSVRISELGATWIIDLDGTVVAHNGHLTAQGDQLLAGVRDFWNAFRENDIVIVVTSRSEEFREITEAALRHFGLRYSIMIMGVPHGERVLINDAKPSGMKTAVAINVVRNAGLAECQISRDPDI